MEGGADKQHTRDGGRDQFMTMSGRRAFWFVVMPLLVVTALGSFTYWGYHWYTSRNGLNRATIAVAAEPTSLAWSADGGYLAAGTMNSSRVSIGGIHEVGGKKPEGPGKVFIVDIGKEGVAATLDTDLGVTGLAFSPDGKWLAVATREFGDGKAEAKLVVYAVPEFAITHTVNSSGAKPGYFQDLAWAADSKSLHAIDHASEGANVRRWTVPEFVEQPAIFVESGQIDALAVAPDGLTMVIVHHEGTTTTALGGSTTLRLFNLEKGKEIRSCKEDRMSGLGFGYGPVGFTADSKTVGVFNISTTVRNAAGSATGRTQLVSWFDVETGKAASPDKAQFAVQPASLSGSRDYAISPDTRTWAHAWNGQGAGRAGMESPEAGIEFRRSDPATQWYWDFEKMGVKLRGNLWAIPGPPALAFSPDGKKLAGTLRTSSGWTIAIWAVP
jgi:hypothetical protein